MSLNERLDRAWTAYREGQHEAAFRIYSELAEIGHVDSQVMVAWMLLKGLGVAADEPAADRWYERAAALGSPVGNFYRGRRLTARGMHAEARGHYEQASRADYLPAIFWMGYSAARGKGTKVDMAEAYYFLLRAARRGHAYALRELGVLDMQGKRGNTWRLVGTIEFLASILLTFLVATVNDDSDLLRA